MEHIFITEYTDFTDQTMCTEFLKGTWESTEADALVQFKEHVHSV